MLLSLTGMPRRDGRRKSLFCTTSLVPPQRRAIPLWLKLAYGGYILALVPAYWRDYGPQNFLWLSDIALFQTGASVILERPGPAGMATVGVLPLELAWCADFVCGGRAIGLAAYMFDRTKPRYQRALSLFHLALPPTLLWLLARLGYDRRSLRRQILLTAIVLPLSLRFNPPDDNINWTRGPGPRGQTILPPALYLALELAVFSALLFWPTHRLLKRLFPPPASNGGTDTLSVHPYRAIVQCRGNRPGQARPLRTSVRA